MRSIPIQAYVLLSFATGIAQVTETGENGFASLRDEDFLIVDERTHSVPGVLSASRDVFARTVAFDFGPVFFKQRSLDLDQRSVLLNGVPMNQYENGRAEWSNWGGLNDALRNQEVDPGFSSSRFFLGKLGGTINLMSFARLYNKGIKVSLAASNRTYTTRLMLTYGSRWLERDWKLNLSVSTRLASEGFREGTPFRAYSFLASVDKVIAGNHFINATTIFAYDLRGMASSMTDEVFQIKGIRYNAHWGMYQGAKRNGRLKRSFQPIFQLNYQWGESPDFRLNAHITCQFGGKGRTRIDYGGSRLLPESGSIIGGGMNPDPTYYQKLPSYFLREEENPDYAGAFLAGQSLIEDGQIDWSQLYAANANRIGGNSVYVLYEDRIDDTMLDFQTDFYRRFSHAMELRGSLSARVLKSRRYALMLDLLGGTGYLDIDPFDQLTQASQSDLRNPNRIVSQNDRFKYDYQMDVNDIRAFVRLDYKLRKQDYFVAATYGIREYMRTGLYENGSYPGEESFGKGEELRFSTLSLKAGITHRFNGRHFVQMFAALLNDPPAIRDSYSNIRENHQIVEGLESRRLLGVELRYHMRLPTIRATLAGYVSKEADGSQVSFFYADGLTGLEGSGTSAFVHEVLTGIGQLALGTEIGVECSISEELRIKGVASMGSAIYDTNPSLYITSDEFDEPVVYGPSSLKGYRVPNGPQQAFALGFEYSDPRYWWLGVTASWFDHSYIQAAPVSRTRNFFTDPDGIRQISYDESIAEKLLRQERLPSFSTVNLVGGKSWKLNKVYLGFFASVNNVLNSLFRSGGYEQSRNANYLTLLEDRSRELPLFSPKYWYGMGTTFYASVYLRTE